MKVFRVFLGLAVAVLSLFRFINTWRTTGKKLKPWRDEPWWKIPKALYGHLTVKHIVKLLVFSTVSEITLQFIKFLYIGGIEIPVIGHVREVASGKK